MQLREDEEAAERCGRRDRWGHCKSFVMGEDSHKPRTAVASDTEDDQPTASKATEVSALQPQGLNSVNDPDESRSRFFTEPPSKSPAG